MMKPIILLIFALLIFSCSEEKATMPGAQAKNQSIEFNFSFDGVPGTWPDSVVKIILLIDRTDHFTLEDTLHFSQSTKKWTGFFEVPESSFDLKIHLATYSKKEQALSIHESIISSNNTVEAIYSLNWEVWDPYASMEILPSNQDKQTLIIYKDSLLKSRTSWKDQDGKWRDFTDDTLKINPNNYKNEHLFLRLQYWENVYVQQQIYLNNLKDSIQLILTGDSILFWGDSLKMEARIKGDKNNIKNSFWFWEGFESNKLNLNNFFFNQKPPKIGINTIHHKTFLINGDSIHNSLPIKVITHPSECYFYLDSKIIAGDSTTLKFSCLDIDGIKQIKIKLDTQNLLFDQNHLSKDTLSIHHIFSDLKSQRIELTIIDSLDNLSQFFKNIPIFHSEIKFKNFNLIAYDTTIQGFSFPEVEHPEFIDSLSIILNKVRTSFLNNTNPVIKRPTPKLEQNTPFQFIAYDDYGDSLEVILFYHAENNSLNQFKSTQQDVHLRTQINKGWTTFIAGDYIIETKNLNLDSLKDHSLIIVPENSTTTWGSLFYDNRYFQNNQGTLANLFKKTPYEIILHLESTIQLYIN